jgi:hypothetical protein
MRHTILFVTFALAGCASSEELHLRADQHMRAAQAAQAAGDHRLTVDEQRKAALAYQRATARAFEESRVPPPPPDTPPPLPLFDPNMQPNGPARSQMQ